MTISYNWLSEYLPQTISPNELSHILTSVGLEVESMESFETITGGLQGLVIGKVISCLPHPNADKLKITQVDIAGSELLSIVCGAPNVAAGQTVVVATVGTTIYPTKGEPFTIKKAKIRGEESMGMICAEDEIGLGDSHAGIIILPEGTTVGMPAAQYYQVPPADIVYEIGLTPNRMDAMSHMGVARDVLAYISYHQEKDVTVQMPSLYDLHNLPQISPITVTIMPDVACSRYAGICLQNITVQDSPEWMQQRLKAIGLRPINNVVDITNYVMHEMGQPLHAFNLAAIEGQTIQVAHAGNQTTFTILDGKEVTLLPTDLMIRHAHQHMCIAGVYGGLHSGVKPDTTAIFLESAHFDAVSIRKTSMRLGLRTDAATRFEKGADISKVIPALQRAIALLVQYAGATIGSCLIDEYPVRVNASTIHVRYQKINSLAGKIYSPQQVQLILSKLGFDIVQTYSDAIDVIVPFSKSDISMEADIVEEIMRIDGLDQIPFTGKIEYSLPAAQTAYVPDIKQQIATQLVAKGFFEIFTNSITHAAYYPDNSAVVKMMNSLSANLDAMRPSMLETGLEAIAYNVNRKNLHLKFFEFGKIYHAHESEFIETQQLALYVSAQYRLPHYSEKNKTADLFYVKGIIENLFPAMPLTYASTADGVQILFQQKPLGTISYANKAQLKNFDIKQDVIFAVVDWDKIVQYLSQYKPKSKEIPRFPIVQRDMAMIVKKGISYQDIQSAVKMAKSTLLQQMNLFDVFESEKIGSDQISYAINLSFYDAQKTLTDAEIEAEMQTIMQSLESKVGALIRKS